MTDQQTILDMMEAVDNQRRARRRFIRLCGGAAAMTGGLSLLAACGGDDDGTTATATPTATSTSGVSDADVLNFALQLEYLEGAYYGAAVGLPLTAASYTGVGTIGTITGGTAVSFTDASVKEAAFEIAYDEFAHIAFLRTTLSSAATALPAINIAGDATGAFTAAARAAGVIGSSDTFNPYASDENFLLGAYLLTDVGVSAYRGAAKLLSNKTYLEASAGILATEAYHDGFIRSTLYAKGLTSSAIYTNAARISDARDALDGSADLDQSIGDATTANLVPTDANGLVLGRTPQQVLNEVYLNKAAVSSGGFFPSGINGNVRTSAASG